MEFNFQTAAFALAALSLGGIGMIMAGSFFWPEQSERYKKQIPTVVIGLVLVGLASAFAGIFM